MTACSPNFFAGVPQNNSSEKPQYEYYYEYIYDDSDENYKGPPLENYNSNSSLEISKFPSSQEVLNFTFTSSQEISNFTSLEQVSELEILKEGNDTESKIISERAVSFPRNSQYPHNGWIPTVNFPPRIQTHIPGIYFVYFAFTAISNFVGTCS